MKEFVGLFITGGLALAGGLGYYFLSPEKGEEDLLEERKEPEDIQEERKEPEDLQEDRKEPEDLQEERKEPTVKAKRTFRRKRKIGTRRR